MMSLNAIETSGRLGDAGVTPIDSRGGRLQVSFLLELLGKIWCKSNIILTFCPNPTQAWVMLMQPANLPGSSA